MCIPSTLQNEITYRPVFHARDKLGHVASARSIIRKLKAIIRIRRVPSCNILTCLAINSACKLGILLKFAGYTDAIQNFEFKL